MKDIRHWFIQKPIANNVPIFENGAQFCEFSPTVSERGCEWIKVFSADDIHKKIGMGLSRYLFIMEENKSLQEKYDKLQARVDELEKAFRDLLESISEPSFEDDRIEWVEVQIDKRDLDAARTFLERVKNETKP